MNWYENMGFAEDERIRRKNQDKKPTEKADPPLSLILGEGRSLADVLETLKNAKFKVSLRGKNTIVIE